MGSVFFWEGGYPDYSANIWLHLENFSNLIIYMLYLFWYSIFMCTGGGGGLTLG